MKCTYCGTELPAGAMFCGECGRAVAAEGAVAPPPARPAGRGRGVERAAERAVEREAERVSEPAVAAPEPVGPEPASAAPTPVEPATAVTEHGPVGTEPAATEPQTAEPPATEPITTLELDRETPVFIEASFPVESSLEPVSDGASDPVPHGVSVSDPVPHEVAVAPVLDEPAVSPAPAPAELRCEQCGATLAPDDIFCGECGFVTPVAARNFSHPRDTAVITPILLADLPPLPPVGTSEPALSARSAPSIPPPQPASAPVFTDSPSPGAPPSAAPPRRPVPSTSAPAATPPAARTSVRAQRADPLDDDHEDVEATRIVSQRRNGDRFILQFSTGESFTVYGTGLIGRNPQPEPAEYFDQLIRVMDPSRSVSKTHLEFGQDSGAFWIKDRFSGNGSIVREPDAEAIRCQPERRYRLVRGSRVDIGEQFFVVS